MYLSFSKRNSDAMSLRRSPEESKKTSVSRGFRNASCPGGFRRSNTSPVPTVTGPLLASTRFNSILDATTYTNVKSPGFTSRLVQCAMDGRSSSYDGIDKHQDKCSSVGLFPSTSFVKRQSSSPIISPSHLKKVGKTPVRIRIAPPPFKEQKSNSVSALNSALNGEAAPRDASEDNSKSVIENLQESSRKRIFSEWLDNGHEDLRKKRQKKGDILFPNPNNSIYHYRHVRAPSVPTTPVHLHTEALPQGKRARERGSPEEQKRQRRKTCTINNAILSSLSSSRNLLEKLATMKRKSMDSSLPSSPIVSSERKVLKENKTCNKAKGVQCSLEPLKSKVVEPQSKPVLNQESVLVVPESLDTPSRVPDVRKVCFSEEPSLPKPLPSDYTTKLFRKEISSPLPRTPSDKERKTSFWVQPPQADELSSSLLRDDSTLDRPERFQSLLACVSGKDLKSKNIEVHAPKLVEDSKVNSISSVSKSPSFPAITSHSAALTVTVSSTSTIMTCSTVTSVKGGSGPEFVRTARPATISSPQPVSQIGGSLSIISSSPKTSCETPSVALSQIPQSAASEAGQLALTSFSIPTFTIPETSSHQAKTESTAIPSTGLRSPAVATISTPFSTSSAPGVPANAASVSSSFSMPLTVASPRVAVSVPSTSAILASSNVTSSYSPFSFDLTPSGPKDSIANGNSFTNPTSFATHPPTVASSTVFSSTSGALGSASGLASVGAGVSTVSKTLSAQDGTSKSDVSTPSFQFGSYPAGISKSGFQFGSTETLKPTFQNISKSAEPGFQFESEKSKPALQFGGNLTPSSKPTSQFGINSTELSKPAFQFGVQSASKPILQFGSGLPEASKPSLQFGVNVSEPSKPSVMFGSSSTETSKQQTIQFGTSSNETSKPMFQFATGSEALKPPFNFNSNLVPKPSSQFRSGSTEASKPASQFGSGSTEASKPAFQFGSTRTEESKSAPLFGTRPTEEAPKSAFQFGSNSNNAKPSQFGSSSSVTSAFQFGSSTTSTPKPAFQFGSTAGENSRDIGFRVGPTQPLSGSGSALQSPHSQQPKGAFAFGPSAQPFSNSGSLNQSQGMFSFGPVASTHASGSSSFGTPSFGPSATATSATFGSGAPTVSTSAFGSPSATGGPMLSGFNNAPSVSNAFNFGSGSVSNSSNPAFQFAKAPLQATTQSLPIGNNSSGPFAFGQSPGNGMPSLQFVGTSPAPPVHSQSGQASGLFSIGSGSAPQRRGRDIRRRR